MNRAYTLLEIKGVDEDAREITGIASTPSPDRMGDIVEPDGAEFKLPIPLLWQHDSRQPIGQVTEAKVTAKGIEIKAKLVKVDDGPLQARLDEAWQYIKSGLVGGLSIGFSAIESARIEGTHGIRFLKWLWLELSAVTIPANGDATIQTVKSIDTAVRAATGHEDGGDAAKASAKATPPGATGSKSLKSINLRPKEGTMTTIAEQIAALEAKRSANAARMNEVMQKSIDEGRSSNEAEQEEFDGLETEIEAIDGDLKRLRALEKAKLATAKAVDPKAAESADGAAKARSGVEVKRQEKLKPGIQFARLARVKALAKLDGESAREMAKSLYGEDSPVVGVLTKAAVPAGSTANSAWAGFLVGEESSVFADFVEYLRPQTILGRFGTDGIPGLRQVPFRVALLGQTSGGEGYWVGEGKPKPLTRFDGERNTLEPLKVANIAVLTEEVLRDSSPSAEAWVRDQLAEALRARLDVDFTNPAKAADSGISPASITNGAPSIASTGTDADAIRLDVRALFNQFILANNAPTNGVWIMSATNALALSMLVNPLGQREFPNIGMSGGTFEGLPVIVSQYVGNVVILANASDVYLADDGGVSVDMSREASLQMDDNPGTQDAITGTGTSLVSLWQTNAVGFRAERTVNWARRRAASVAYLTGVAWGGAVPAS